MNGIHILFTMMQTKRCAEIELLRIVAAVAVVLFHAGYYDAYYFACSARLPRGGFIAVEFFFLLSGYLLAAHVAKKDGAALSSKDLGKETYLYLWRRLCSFWPELFIACCIGMCVFAWAHHFAVHETLRMAHDTLMGNMLLLQMTALAPSGINGPAWYLSSLMLCSGILYPLFRRFGASPLWVVCSFLLLGWILTVGELSRKAGFGGFEWMGWTYKFNIRAFAELAIGASLYPLVQHLSGLRVSRLLAWALTMLKCACYGIVLLYCFYPSGRSAPITLLALVCVIVLCFSRLCLDRDWYQHAWVIWLGRFSLPLYLSHAFWGENMAALFPEVCHGWLRLLLYCSLSVATALIVMWAGKQLRRVARTTAES